MKETPLEVLSLRTGANFVLEPNLIYIAITPRTRIGKALRHNRIRIIHVSRTSGRQNPVQGKICWLDLEPGDEDLSARLTQRKLAAFLHPAQESLVDGRRTLARRTQFGMEGGRQVPPIVDEHRIAAVGSQRPDARTGAANDRRTDEDRFYGAPFHIESGNVTVELAPISVAFHGDIHELERGLRRVRDFGRDQNGAGAGPKNWFAAPEFVEHFEQAPVVEQLEHGSTFAARQNEPFGAFQILVCTDFERGRSKAFHGLAMSFKIPL